MIPRKRIFTPEALAGIPAMVASGMKSQAIADQIGSTKGSLIATCSRNGIRLTSRPRRQRLQQLGMLLTKATMEALSDRAAKSGCTKDQLVSKLLEVIVEDDLFNAVLDKEEA